MHTKNSARVIFAASTIASSWLLMQIIHEAGHVLGAFVTGGQVRRVVLVPWELSRTDLLQNPQPLFVCWAGPIVGALAPTLVWAVAARLRWSSAFWLRFLAGFCLIANGAYIGVGAFTRDGDGGDLLRDGSPGWTLWLFGVVTIPIGFVLWHRLGKEFGIGRDAKEIHWRAVTGSALILIVIVITESLVAQF